jgi:type IV fimbrial biogenesis protein FimT
MLKPTTSPRHRRGRDPGRGFTLIELLTTLSVLGVLLQLSLPSFTIWINNTRIRTVADSLQNGVRLAQAEAVRRNRQVVLSFTDRTPALGVPAVAGGTNWSIQTVAQFGGGDAEFVQGGSLVDVASGVTIGAIGPAVNALCFNSNGRLTLNNAPGPAGAVCRAAAVAFEVNRASADRRLRVLVGVGGQLRMCDPGRPTLSSASPDGCP